MKMKIYVQILDGYGKSSWYNQDEVSSYLLDGKELVAEDEFGYEYENGTPFPTARAAKRAASHAKDILVWNGRPGPMKAVFWRKTARGLLRTRFDRAGRIIRKK